MTWDYESREIIKISLIKKLMLWSVF